MKKRHGDGDIHLNFGCIKIPVLDFSHSSGISWYSFGETTFVVWVWPIFLDIAKAVATLSGCKHMQNIFPNVILVLYSIFNIGHLFNFSLAISFLPYINHMWTCLCWQVFAFLTTVLITRRTGGKGGTRAKPKYRWHRRCRASNHV